MWLGSVVITPERLYIGGDDIHCTYYQCSLVCVELGLAKQSISTINYMYVTIQCILQDKREGGRGLAYNAYY